MVHANGRPRSSSVAWHVEQIAQWAFQYDQHALLPTCRGV